MRQFILILLVATLIGADDESDYRNLKDDKGNVPFLGVTMTPTSSDAAERNKIDPSHGVEIAAGVFSGTAAERMGLKQGDVIMSVNGNSVDSMTDLRNEVALIGVGGDAKVVVMRDGKQVVASEKLGVWPESVSRDPIDDAAERRFRDWQARKLDRLQQAVNDQRKRVEDAERASNEKVSAPAQAMHKPASQALRSLPAWKVTINAMHDTKTAVRISNDEVAWDARVLIGTPAPTIY
ncbi:MAG: PDZ domain-containing protein [Planctomycetota bacterium]